MKKSELHELHELLANYRTDLSKLMQARQTRNLTDAETRKVDALSAKIHDIQCEYYGKNKEEK